MLSQLNVGVSAQLGGRVESSSVQQGRDHANTGLRRWVGRLNFLLGGLALIFGVLGVLMFVEGQRPGSTDRHAGLWGAFAAIVFLPFAVSFGIAGWAWHRAWPRAAAVQLAPLLVLPVLIALGWWLSRIPAPAP